jgi:MFS transporter, DHA2 family, multidrug resistance protein
MKSTNVWLVAVTVTLATFMELLDTSIANVSLPHIAGGLGNTVDETTWVLTSYLVANAVVLPLSAWLSQVFGRKNYYMACVALFTISSLLCGLAPSLPLLIFFRVLQGIGGGGLAPVEQAILVDTFPAEKRAAAFGLYSMAIVTAPAVGPPLGGWITDHMSWHWVFLINIPIGIISLILSHRLVQDPPEYTQAIAKAKAENKLKVDWIGILLVAIAFSCLEVTLDRGQREDWFQSSFIVTFFTISMIALVAGIIWELKNPDPVVELKLLKDRNFALANMFYLIFGFVLFGSTVLIPQILESLFKYSATDAGLVLGPGAMVIVVLAPVIVKLVAKTGPKILALIGFFILGLSMWHYAHIDLSVNYHYFAMARVLQGLGLAFLFVPISQVAYSYLPKDKNNKASSLTNLFRNQGGSIGIAYVTTQLEQRGQFHRARITEHLTSSNHLVASHLDQYTQHFINGGYSSSAAQHAAVALLNQTVNHQASLLGFTDCFWILGLVAFTGFILAMFIRSGSNSQGSSPAH